MTHVVLDNSIVLSWCLADENHPIAEKAMRIVIEDGAVVPGIWWYELRNALVVNERRGRLDAAHTRSTLADLRELPIEIDHEHNEAVLLDLSRQNNLSVYDAAYLEVARRRALPLASLDRRLCEAASACDIALLEEDQGMDGR